MVSTAAMVCVERPPSNPLSRIDCSQIGNPHLQAALPSSCERGQGDDRGFFRRSRLGRCRCYDTVDAVSKLRPANLIFPCMGNVRDYVAFREGAKTCRGNTQQPSFSLPQPQSLRRGRAALQAIADDQREDARSGPSRCRPIAQQPSQSDEFINRAAEQPVHFDMRQIDHSQFSLLPFGRGQSRSMTLPRWIAGKHQVQRRNQLRGCCDMVISARAGKG
jgi:hypothetical protein